MATETRVYGRAYRPGDVQIISQAFDDAWESIAPSFEGCEERIESARSKLADAVLAVAARGVSKPTHLKTVALVEFLHEWERRGTLPKLSVRPPKKSDT
jgi:hypothetical protein